MARPKLNPDARLVAPATGATKPVYRVPARPLAPVASAYVTGNAPISSPYDATSPSSNIPRPPDTGPWGLASHFRRTIGSARHLYRNNGNISKGLRNVTSNVIGIGPRPVPRFPELKPIFAATLKSIDARQRFSWGGWLRAVYLAERVDGEVFIRIRPRREDELLGAPFQLEALEADHVPWDLTRSLENGRRIVNGIELGPRNVPAAFWMYRNHPQNGSLGGLTGANLPVAVPAGSVIHIANPARLGDGLRGESSLIAAIVPAVNLGKYDLAEAQRKLVSTLFAGFIKRTPEDGGRPLPGEEDADDISALLSQVVLEPGMLSELPYGTTIEFNNPPDTGASFESYVRFKQMYLAACVDTGYEDFTGDWRGASDRTWRAQQVATRLMADQERDRLLFQLLDRITRLIVDYAIASGKFVPPAGTPDHELYDVRWIWPGAKNPNEYQETNAKVLAIKNGLASRDDMVEGDGGDPEEIDRRNGEGIRRASNYGVEYDVHRVSPANPISDAFHSMIDEIVAEKLRSMGITDVDPDGDPPAPEPVDTPPGGNPPKPAPPTEKKPPAKKAA